MKKLIILLFTLAFLVCVMPQDSFSQEKKEDQGYKSRVQDNIVDITTPVTNAKIIKSELSDGQKVLKTSTGNYWGGYFSWNPWGVPSSTDDVIINSDIRCNPGEGYMYQCASLTINSGRTLTLSPSQLDVTGNVTNNGTITLNAGSSSNPTYLTFAGEFTNTGTVNGTNSYTNIICTGTTAQTFTNNGIVTAPMYALGVQNTEGLILAGSNQITCFRVNLFTGSITNSNKITLGNGGKTTAAVQIGGSNTYAAGTFDKSPTFNAGTGGIQLLYAPALDDYSTSNEVPIDGNVAYFLVVCTPRTLTLRRDITIPYIYTTGLNLSSGNLSIGSNTLTINGTIGITSGTLTGSTSSNIIFSGTPTTTLPAVIGGLNNLTINNPAGIAIGGNVIINGILTLVNGLLTTGINLTMANGATINRSNGSLSSAPTFGTSVNLIYSGANPITTGVENPVSSSVLNNLTINNAGGITLGSNTTVNGSTTLTNGLLKTTSIYTLYFGTSAPTFSEVCGAYIEGTAIMNQRTAGMSELNFLNCFIHTGANIGNVTITRVTGNDGIISANGNNSISANWDIATTIPLNTGATKDVTYGWPCDLDNAHPFAPAILAQMYYVNGAALEPVGNSVDVSGSDPRSMNVTHTHFSKFTIGASDAPLPVSLSSFSSNIASRNVMLNWTTTSENNNAGFNVERMISNGKVWEKIGFVCGKGTMNTSTNYTFEDRNLQTGKYNYRLKQMDVNGNFEYFALNCDVEIGVPDKFNISQNYPNPFNPVTKIDFDLPYDSKVNIVLYDMTGRLVKTLLNEPKTAGYHTVNFNASDLSSGMYFYMIVSDKFVMTKKMALVK